MVHYEVLFSSQDLPETLIFWNIYSLLQYPYSAAVRLDDTTRSKQKRQVNRPQFITNDSVFINQNSSDFGRSIGIMKTDNMGRLIKCRLASEALFNRIIKLRLMRNKLIWIIRPITYGDRQKVIMMPGSIENNIVDTWNVFMVTHLLNRETFSLRTGADQR